MGWALFIFAIGNAAILLWFKKDPAKNKKKYNDFIRLLVVTGAIVMLILYLLGVIK